MAAKLKPVPADASPADSVSEATLGRLSPMARLAELHDEAAETALLANLLGRSPYLAALLALCAGATVWYAHAHLAPLLTWCVLVAAGLVAMLRAYGATIAQSFERAPLRSFARDMLAISLYVGFAWGAGSFLALPSDAGTLEVLAFTVVPIGVVAAMLRASDLTAAFALPAAFLSALAPLVKESPYGAITCVAVLAAAFVISGAVYGLVRIFSRDPNFAVIPSH